MKLQKELNEMQKEIESIAKSYGLDFFDTIFELIDAKFLYEIASYGGFPNRYPHWRFGMEFDHMSKGHEYGLHRIYELVINNDPCYAYLMRSNTMVDQKLVMAHVFAHCDFFKNNYSFKTTNRKMLNQMANHASRVRSFQEAHGEEEVENFIDMCLSIENLIDVHRAKSKKDILGFLIENAKLEEWQREVLSMIREEAYYFAPQGQTKIMNEGWASFWHARILTEKVLKDAEVIDFADHHAAALAMQPGHINPYKLGLEIYRDIEDRWNKGKFGREYEECDDLDQKRTWDRKLGQGMSKIFEVRKLYNDVTFIDEFLTAELCERQKLFVYQYNKRNGTYEIQDRDPTKIKEKLLFGLTNFGQPFIFAQDGNYEGKGELFLTHEHHGLDLKLHEAKETLERIYKIWKKSVHLETIINGEKRILIYDGQEHRERAV